MLEESSHRESRILPCVQHFHAVSDRFEKALEGNIRLAMVKLILCCYRKCTVATGGVITNLDLMGKVRWVADDASAWAKAPHCVRPVINFAIALKRNEDDFGWCVSSRAKGCHGGFLRFPCGDFKRQMGEGAQVLTQVPNSY
jgi:hypothetical protein